MQENGFVTCQEIDKGISPRYNRTGNNWMESSGISRKLVKL